MTPYWECIGLCGVISQPDQFLSDILSEKSHNGLFSNILLIQRSILFGYSFDKIGIFQFI